MSSRWGFLRWRLREAEDGRAPEPAIPELLLDAGDLDHTPHLVDDPNLDDEVDALGRGDGGIPHRHLPGNAHQVGNTLEGVTGRADVLADVYKLNVVLVSYSMLIPYLMLVLQTTLKTMQTVDMQKLDAY